MAQRPLTTAELASQLRAAVGLLVRRLRQAHAVGDLSLAESSALARVERDGPMTAAELARAEHISPQSMGATLQALHDGRRVLLSVSEAGRALRARRQTETAERLALALESELTAAERARLSSVVGLLQRLAENL